MPPMIHPVNSLQGPSYRLCQSGSILCRAGFPEVLKFFIEDIEQPLVVDKVMNHTRFG